jgi:hypothetical protein
MAVATKRAKAGGEFGANGEWYEGGRFINTVPENPKREGSNQSKARKNEIAPYKWELVPAGHNGCTIYRQFAGTFGRIDFTGKAVMAFSDDPERLACVLNYCGKTREQAQALLDRYNAGERWL